MLDLFNIKGKKAIVTGGTRGLGNGMAEGLLEAGAEVAIWGTSDKVHKLAKDYTDKGFICYGVIADLSDRESVKIGFDKSLSLLGEKLDILINAAGVQKRNSCEEFSNTDWDSVIRINLTAMFELCQMAGLVMLKQGQGKIINVASMLSFFGGYTVPAYAASKGGAAQVTKALSNEWAGKGIQINAVAPGYMDTQMNTALINDSTRNAEILSRIPAGRWGRAQDMKGITVFLASAASDYISGAIIPVDGGYLGR